MGIKEGEIKGAILADQVKSLDWRRRDVKFIARAPLKVINEVIELLSTLVS